MFANLVSTFVSPSKGPFFMAPERLRRAEDRCVADGYLCCVREMAAVH